MEDEGAAANEAYKFHLTPIDKKLENNERSQTSPGRSLLSPASIEANFYFENLNVPERHATRHIFINKVFFFSDASERREDENNKNCESQVSELKCIGTARRQGMGEEMGASMDGFALRSTRLITM